MGASSVPFTQMMTRPKTTDLEGNGDSGKADIVNP
jgi:hypothetical protein